MLTRGTEYVETGLNYYEEKYKECVLRGLQKRARDLGMALVPLLNKEEIIPKIPSESI